MKISNPFHILALIAACALFANTQLQAKGVITGSPIDSGSYITFPTFNCYADFVSKAYNICWKIPKGFIDADSSLSWVPYAQEPTRRLAITYAGTLKSKDGNCMILYSDPFLTYTQAKEWKALPFYDLYSKFTLCEIQTAILGREAFFYRKEAPLPLNESSYFYDYPGTNSARTMMRAGTMQIVNLPLKKNFNEIYSHCTAVYVHKAGRPTMFFKLFTTEKGFKDIDSYLDLLFKNTKYLPQDSSMAYEDALALRLKYMTHIDANQAKGN